MANHMAEVAKMLGVELGERFKIIDTQTNELISCYDYYFSDKDICIDTEDIGCPSNYILIHLIHGNFIIKRKPWKPEDDENYWYIDENGEAWRNRFDDCEYASDHMNYYKLGNCYRTREEAEANRDKWVAFYASDEVLEV